MGASSICVTAQGSDPMHLYNVLKGQAHQDHGSDAYNGSISTTDGCFIFSGTLVGPSGRRKMEEEALKKTRKWGPVAAFPIAKIKGKKEVVLTVHAASDAEAKQQAEEQLAGKEYTVTSITTGGTPHSGRVRRSVYGGKRKVIWQIQTRSGLEQFPTQKEAEARAEKILIDRVNAGQIEKYGGKIHGNEISVTPIIVFEGGNHAQDKSLASTVSIGVFDKKASWDVKVAVYELSTEIEKWVFVGWAAS